mgnify:CR=1 FL=1
MIEENQFLENKHPILTKIMDLIVPAIDDLPGAGSMGLLKELMNLCEEYACSPLSKEVPGFACCATRIASA